MLNINYKIKENFARLYTYLLKKLSFKLNDYPPNGEEVQIKI